MIVFISWAIIAVTICITGLVFMTIIEFRMWRSLRLRDCIYLSGISATIAAGMSFLWYGLVKYLIELI